MLANISINGTDTTGQPGQKRRFPPPYSAGASFGKNKEGKSGA